MDPSALFFSTKGKPWPLHISKCCIHCLHSYNVSIYQTNKYNSGGSGVSTHNVQPDGTLKHLQTLTFNMTGPGPVSDRQDKPHPHQAILDPSEQFIVVPDLGADLVRIFSIDPETALLTEQAPYKAPAAAGPRHGVFRQTESGDVYYYLVSELDNKITSFEVTYNTGKDLGLTLTKIDSHGIYGNRTTPAGAAAAACLLSVSLLSIFTPPDPPQLM